MLSVTAPGPAALLCCRLLFLVSLVSLVSVATDAAPLKFPYSVGGAQSDQTDAHAVAVHPTNGRIFFGGTTASNAGFTSPDFTSINQTGGFLVHAYPSGQRIWAKSIGWGTKASTMVTAIDVYAHASVPLAQHFVVACGYTAATVPAKYAPSAIHGGSSMPFLQQYTLNGDLQWETGFPSLSGSGRCLGVKTMTGGRIVVLLQNFGTYSGLSSGSGSEQAHGLALMAFHANGEKAWFMPYGGGAGVTGDLAVHDTGDLATSAIYAAGSVSASFNGQAFLGVSDLVVWRASAVDGALVWAKQMGGSDNDLAKAVAVSPDHAHVYVAGEASSSNLHYPPGHLITKVATFEPILLQMEAATGAPIAGIKVANPSSAANAVTGLAVNPANGDVFASGYTSAPSFNGIASRGSYDCFTMCLTSALAHQWTAMAGGPSTDFGMGLVFSPYHAGVFAVGYTAGAMAPSSTSAISMTNAGAIDVFLVGFEAASGAPLKGTDYSYAWVASVGANSASWEESAPIIDVPYSKRDTDVVVQLSLEEGATLLVSGTVVESHTLTIRAPLAVGAVSAPATFTVAPASIASPPIAYTLCVRTAAASIDAGWLVVVSHGGFSQTVDQASAAGARAVALPSSARGQAVTLTFTLPYGAHMDSVLVSDAATMTAPASQTATVVTYTFTVTAEDGMTHSGPVTLSLSVAPSTESEWTAVTAALNGSTSTLLSSASSLTLVLPASDAGQQGTLTFALDPYASVGDASGNAGLSATSLLFVAPSTGASVLIPFSVISEAGTVASYAFTLTVLPSSATDWAVSLSGGAPATFTRQFSSDSSLSERTVILPAEARDLPFQLDFTGARNSTFTPLSTASPFSLTAPASAAAPATEYNFTVTAQDGATTSGLVILQFSVAPFTERGVTIQVSVAHINFTSAALVSSHSPAGAPIELTLHLPTAAAGLNCTLTLTLPPFASLADGSSPVRVLVAAPPAGAVFLNFSVEAEDGAVQAYTLRLQSGPTNTNLELAGGSNSSGLSDAQRNAAIAVPVIVGGLLFILLVYFASRRCMRRERKVEQPPASIGAAVPSVASSSAASVPVPVAIGGEAEMAPLPAPAPAAAAAASPLEEHHIVFRISE